VQDFVAASRSKATLRAYKSDWRDFEKWCESHCLITLPAAPGTVAAYLSAMAMGPRPAKLATIRRRLATIDYAHRCVDQRWIPSGDPVVSATMAGIARTIGSAHSKKTALTAALPWLHESEHAAPSTIRRRLAALSSLFKHLVRHGQAARNPVAENARPAINRHEGSTLAFAKAQARRMLDAPAEDTRRGSLLFVVPLLWVLRTETKVRYCVADGRCFPRRQRRRLSALAACRT
jgi:site-specific recombinase XerD